MDTTRSSAATMEKKGKGGATEERNARTRGLHRLSAGECAALILEEDREVLDALKEATTAIGRLADEAAARFIAGGRLIYIGAGTSGRLGVLDASELPPTFHCAPERAVGLIAGGDHALRHAVEGAEDDPCGACPTLDALALTSHDVVIGIASSGTTPYVVGALDYVRGLGVGALTAMIACSETSATADHVITLHTGPEVITGSTRMKAGTATKMVLNALSTSIMVQAGAVYDNLMVDLSVSNKKLSRRACRIVMSVCGVSQDAAQKALRQVDGCPKAAIILLMEKVGAAEARQRLTSAGGVLHRVIDRVPEESSATLLRIVIDGGATKTRAFVLDAGGEKIPLLVDGHTCFDAVGPGCNIHSGSPASVATALSGLLGKMALAADSKPLLAAAANLSVEGGIAGLCGNREHSVVEQVLRRLGIQDDNIRLSSDSVYLAGILKGEPGVIVIAGTGSSCLASDGDKQAVVGGLGHVLGDEGSGYAVGKQALRAAIAAERGWGAATELAGLLVRRLGVSRVEEILLPLNNGSLSKDYIAALAPTVLEAVERGDSVAQQIVEEQLQRLSEQAASAHAQLNALESPIHLVGGLFEHPFATAVFSKAMGTLCPQAQVVSYVENDPFHLSARFFCDQGTL